MSFQKKIITAFVLIFISTIIMVFMYVNKDYEGIKNKKVDFSVNISQLEKEFQSNPIEADKKYSQKVILIEGVFSELKQDSSYIHLYYKGANYDVDILLDNKIIQQVSNINQPVKVKTLYVGYEPPDDEMMLPGIIRMKDGIIK